MRWRDGVAFGCLIAAFACGPRERDPRPNVILISLDSVRRDLLGCYGASLPHAGGRSPSPNLDRLAASGARVRDAVSGTSWTLPAHATLFTGLPELVHGVEQDGQRIPDELPTLADQLRVAGYRTAGVYSCPYLDPRYGFGRGFDRYEAGYGPALAAAAERARATLAKVHELAPSTPDDSTPRGEGHDVVKSNASAEQALELASHGDASASAVTAFALSELARAADDSQPFFLFAHFFDAHYDYVPPAPFERAFDPGYEGETDGRDFARRIGAPAPAARDVEHLRALQAGELASIDAAIGRILAELERRGLAQNTLVVVVGDHGDEFMEHGSFGHRRTLYEEVLQVPMLLCLPGKVDAGLVLEGGNLADVAPTVLALLGISQAPAPLLAQGSRAPALGRLVLNPTGMRSGVRVLESYRAGSLKLVRERALAGGDERLRWIDLALHPEERDSDWSSDFADERARAALDRFRADHGRLARERRAVPLAQRTEDLLALFRGLGYVGQDAAVAAIPGDELVLPTPGAGLAQPASKQ